MVQSAIEDPTTWRLTTPGGVPIRYLGIEGEFEQDDGSVTVRALIPANRFLQFLCCDLHA